MNCEKPLKDNAEVICLEGNGYRPSHKGDGYRVGGAMYTLNETEVHAVCYLVYESHNQDSRYRPLGEICETVSAKYGTGGGNQPIVLRYEPNVDVLPFDTTQITSDKNWSHPKYGDPCHPLASGQHPPTVVMQEREMADSIVRRLTPRECERLQGMPDDWSKYGINEKGEVYELPDSARYRLQGNGIATPFWKYLLKRISAQYERDPTMGSLFDGQASFPMLWEGINGCGTCLWSSEIDKHAVAVAKYHFPESE